MHILRLEGTFTASLVDSLIARPPASERDQLRSKFSWQQHMICAACVGPRELPTREEMTIPSLLYTDAFSLIKTLETAEIVCSSCRDLNSKYTVAPLSFDLVLEAAKTVCISLQFLRVRCNLFCQYFPNFCQYFLPIFVRYFGVVCKI